ncbi:hypothetical protein ACQP0C_20890 [Nocardia sp. CA-129566]|uniref:hypothetical protein n=1 Tax=Nocardia sp. CA-129566 TaxID=3239976 RepID=UPI003D977A6F
MIAEHSVAELTTRARHRIDVTFAGKPPDLGALRRIDGVRRVEPNTVAVHIDVDGSTAELIKAIAPYDVVDIVSHEPDLEEVFLAYYGKD